jgi:cardiolipin synthase
MFESGWIAVLVFVMDFAIRLGLSIRVIMRRLPVGVSLAWLFVVLVFPLVGAAAYLLFGELRLGRRHADRAKALHEPYQNWLTELQHRTLANIPHSDVPASRLIEHSVGIPALPGNRLELLSHWEAALRALIGEIDAARRTCHLEFYIWHAGGVADEVGAALARAAGRGVTCRVLLDDVGSRPFLRGPWPARLRAAGVQLHAALKASLLRVAFVRYDLRMHRKIVVIDGRIGFTGSLNLVDPRYFKQDAGVGQWVDALVRIEGPAVEPLAITFLEDWALESGDTLEGLEAGGDVHPVAPQGGAAVQVVPSGPAQDSRTMERILLAVIYGARSELILTTPYFVPDEAMVQALLAAVQRGVQVTLIVPERVDSRLVQWASRAFLGDLVQAGVQVLFFREGLLHTKSLAADGELCLFGSLNLDPRSLHLNFEITLAIYDIKFARELKELQQRYAAASRASTFDEWRQQTRWQRLVDDTARLLGPLL